MKIKKEDLKELYPLTRMQEGMLFHALRDPASPAYTEQVVWRVSGKLDVSQYQRAWDEIHARYEALRSVFTHEKTKQPLQLVLKERAADFAFVSLLETPTAERQAVLLKVREEQRREGFDLSSGPLLRIRVHQFDAAGYEICVTWHHILLDGWSTHLMFQDLLATYTALCAGQTATLPPLPPYARYVEWLERQDTASSLAWWREQLQDYEGVAEIPRRGVADSLPASLQRCEFRLDEGQHQALQTLARDLDVTPSSLLQAAWGIVLGRYCDSRDVVFGSVVSGRSPEVPGIERLPGLLINTVPVRVRHPAGESFRSVAARVHRQAVDAQAHHACRLADIQNATEQRADLIKHLLVYENYPAAPTATAPDAPALQVVETAEPTNYDLLVVADPAQTLRVELQYNSAAYDEALIRQLAGHLQTLLMAAIGNPDAPLADLDMLSAAEREFLIDGLNATRRDTPRDSNLAAQFAVAAQQHADRTALVHPGGSLSYRELDQRSSRLANHLAASGVQAGERVVVLLDRSPELIEALLAILKLGAVYVPIDPDGPLERLQFVIRDAGVKTVILRATSDVRLTDVTCIHPDADTARIAACGDALAPSPARGGDEACLFYTSGSTGTPKAVRVAQRGILRLTCNADYVTLSPADRVAHLSNVAFDAASFEIWGALLNGAEVHILDRDTALTPSALARAIRERGLTTMFLTTALFNQVAREAADAFAPLTNLLTGGELVDEKAMQRVLERGAPQRLLHVYGPTETTTFATWQRVTAIQPGATVPIGLPIANTTAYVVDRDLRLQPLGAEGELLLGGDGVALGYLNQPELSAERFIANPFAAGETLYRTGDIVRRRLDGSIEFIGRRDHQIKLRGFRIELGEIESALRDFPQVDAALVTVYSEEGSANRKLVAYLGMAATPGATTDLELRKFLKRRLPDYMIPSSFVILERLPLTANGKVDRAALPKPSRAGTGFGKAFIAPVGELENQLAQIWASVLGIAGVGRNDSFFELGGHSLSASTAISHIRAALGADVALPFFFQCPNLQTLAVEVQRLRDSAPSKPAGISRVAREAYRGADITK